MADEQNIYDPKEHLRVLKGRADILGIVYSNNIGIEALQRKIAEKQEGTAVDQVEPEQDDTDEENTPETDDTVEEVVEDKPEPAPVVSIAALVAESAPAPVVKPLVDPKPNTIPTADAGKVASKPVKQETLQEMRIRLYAEQMALKRVRITNLNPAKADLPGEIFTVANEFIGNVRKYVPYGEGSEEGFHLPVCILTQLRERKFQHIKTTKNRKTNTPEISSKWVNEFAIEELPPLTQEELVQLATAQIAAGSVDAVGDLA